MDRLTSMAIFVKAADIGSFSATASKLGLSAQMVGKHVGFLEARIGAQLLRRTTRQQSLTDIGRAFYDRCHIILAETEAAESLVQNLSTTPRGRLRLNAPVSFGASRVAPLIRRYLRAFPLIEAELVLTDRYVDVIDEGYDAVFRLGPLNDTELLSRKLADHRQIACASPSYLEAHEAPQTPEDLTGHECLGFVNWSGLHYSVWSFAKDGQIHSVKVRSRFQVNDGRVLLAAALAGEGIILQPEAVLKDDLDSGRLVQVLRSYEAPARPLYLLYSGGRDQTLKMRTFIDFAVKELGDR